MLYVLTIIITLLGTHFIPLHAMETKQLQEKAICSLCLNVLQVLDSSHYSINRLKSPIRRLQKCGHMFHAECLHPWLQKNLRCPYCSTQTSKADSISIVLLNAIHKKISTNTQSLQKLISAIYNNDFKEVQNIIRQDMMQEIENQKTSSKNNNSSSELSYLQPLDWIDATSTIANYVDENGRTPLMYAAALGSVNIARYLIKVGADKNTQDMYGLTALMFAAQNNHVEVVELLIEKGAIDTLECTSGRTALNYADNRQNFTIIRMLMPIGAVAKFHYKKDPSVTTHKTRFAFVRQLVSDFFSWGVTSPDDQIKKDN